MIYCPSLRRVINFPYWSILWLIDDELYLPISIFKDASKLAYCRVQLMNRKSFSTYLQITSNGYEIKKKYKKNVKYK